MMRVQERTAVIVSRRLTAHDGQSGRMFDSRSLMLYICVVGKRVAVGDDSPLKMTGAIEYLLVDDPLGVSCFCY